MTIHAEWILPPLRPLSVRSCPKPSGTDLGRSRQGLRQGAVHYKPLDSHGDFFSIFHKGDAKDFRHDRGFISMLEVLGDGAFCFITGGKHDPSASAPAFVEVCGEGVR